MSFYTYYQAIPERSRLLRRLRGGKRFCCLYTWLIPYGPGPFHLGELDPSELDDILDAIADGMLFSSRAEVDECLGEITAEITEAVTAYPGPGERAAYIEKQHDEIEGTLARELRCRGSRPDVRLLTGLLYGGDDLAPEFFDRHESQLRLIPASAVAEGAKMLAGVELSEEAHDISDYAYEQFREWKGLLMEAARRDEAVMVFPTG